MTEIALITGAASGIGRCCAVELARNGYDLVLWGVNEEGLIETSDMLKNPEFAARVITAVVNVADRKAVDTAALEAKAQKLTPTRIIAAAGIVRLDSTGNQDAAAGQLQMEVNYNGVVNTVQSFRDDKGNSRQPKS